MVCVPCGIVFWMRGGSDLDKNGVSQQNIGIYVSLLHDSINIKQLLYMVSLSFEFRHLKISREQEQELNNLKEYSAFFPKGKQLSPQMVKVIFLLLAHMDRADLPIDLQKEQEIIVANTLKIMNTVIESGLILNHMPRGKKISVTTFDLLLDFSRCLVQAVPFQSPCSEVIDGLQGNKQFAKCGSVKEIKALLESDRSKNLQVDLEAVKNNVNALPELSAEATVIVEGEEDIRLSDLLTINLKIFKKAPIKPLPQEKVWAIIADSKRTMFLKSFPGTSDKIEDSSMQIPLDRKLGFSTGKQVLDIYIKSDSYIGIDTKISIDFNVLNPLKPSN